MLALFNLTAGQALKVRTIMTGLRRDDNQDDDRSHHRVTVSSLCQHRYHVITCQGLRLDQAGSTSTCHKSRQ